MRTPLVVVTGVDPAAMDATLLSLAWDLPRAVSVRHTIDPESQVLTRTVSDASGVVERHEVDVLTLRALVGVEQGVPAGVVDGADG